MSSASRFLEGPRAHAFDVICAGEALVFLGESPEMRRGGPLRVMPGGGAVSSSLALARQGLKVGLCTVLEPGSFGQSLLAQLDEAGVDKGGIEVAKHTSGIVFIRGGARQAVSLQTQEQPVSVPEGWSSKVLLLSGMSPIVSHGAALCKAARAGRRMGSMVVVDVNARWDLWAGRDARSIRMILREADVVWASAEDLFGLNMDVETMRAAMRPSAVLALSDATGSALAWGPFGEVAPSKRAPAAAVALPSTRAGTAFVTSICAEVARAGNTSPESPELWARALQRGLDIALSKPPH
jgi:2-dehydro-3-deoxygluconokinase